ncbi:MAG: hypothetical protein NWE83_08070 [Candidatus Bathyarchaeota archaeon]|nr:hypothetical protein [Candidatus Bathyarchaeota archaeon]
MNKILLLRYYFLVFGMLSIATAIIIPWFFPQFLWEPRNIPQELMISCLYIAMGIVMVASASDPVKHKGFIDFIILANVLHAGVMIVVAENIFHLVVDALFIGLMGILPLGLYPWKRTQFLRSTN